MYTIISTFATDVISHLDTGQVESRQGGSGYWIKKLFDKKNVAYNIITGRKNALIEAKIRFGEALPGKIKDLSPILINSDIKSEGIIICTMKDEFDINQVTKLEGVIALDIAGFTRSGRWGTEKEKIKLPDKKVTEKIDILKANEEEFPFVPEEWINDQKENRIFLHTLGKNGVDMWVRGKLFHLEAPDLQPKNVLGAGDTFTASFLISYIRNSDALKACKDATEDVKKLFSEKIEEEKKA